MTILHPLPAANILAAFTLNDLTDAQQPVGQIFWAMSVPIAALVVLLLATLAWRGTRWSSILLPPVMAASLMAVAWIIKGTHPPMPPTSAPDWIFWLAIPLGLIGAVMNWQPRRWVNLLLALIATAASSYVLALGVLKTTRWTTSQAFLWIGIAAGGMLVQWFIVSQVHKRFAGAIVPLALTLITIITAATAGLPGRSANLAMQINILVACGMVLTLASLFSNFRIGEGTFLVWTLLTGLLFTSTWNDWYSYLPLTDAIPVFAAPLLLLAILAMDAGRPKTRAVTMTLLILAALWPVLVEIYKRVQDMRDAGLM